MAGSSYTRFSIRQFYVLGMKTFLLITQHEKNTAHIEEIGELEDKKDLSKDILVFSKEIWKATLWKGPLDFRLDFQVLLSRHR